MKTVSLSPMMIIPLMLGGCAGIPTGEYATAQFKDAEISYAQLDANLTLRYLKLGRGEPLLLIHTMRTQLDYFERVIPLLAKTFTVYAIDLPGHGYSTIDRSAAYSEPQFRQAVTAFIDKLDLSKVTIVGESIGGVLALAVANAIPHKVTHVYSINPYDYGGRYGGGIRRSSVYGDLVIGSFGIPVIGQISAALENRFVLRKILEGGLRDTQNLPPELLAEFDAIGRRHGYRHVERSTFSNWKSWIEARQLYSSVKAPTTFIYGDGDWSYEGERNANVAAVPNARLVTLKDTGHFASLERAREIAEIIQMDAGPMISHVTTAR